MIDRCRHFISNLGPGLVTGAADDDPSGISTYAIAGASAGFSMLWVALLTTPMMAVIQGMCARIGMVTGKGLAAAIRQAFPPWVAWTLAAIVLVANTINIGADLAGMGVAMTMLVKAPALLWIVFFAALLVTVQLFTNYTLFLQIVKYLAVSLFAYIITAFIVSPNWLDVLRHTFIPEFRLDGKWLATLTAVFGTTITPYLFFWQSSLMVEEERAQGKRSVASRRGATASEIAAAHADVNSGMLFSNLVMFFIILTTAATLAQHGKGTIATAQDAANALRPLAGNFAYLLFTAGIVGTGLLAIPALAGSSAFLAAETFGFREGLDEKPKRAPKFYGVIVAGVAVGVAMNLLHIDPIGALFWSAVINGVAAVPLVGVIIVLANRRSLMGRWRSSRLANAWALATFAVMTLSAVAMFAYWGKS